MIPQDFSMPNIHKQSIILSIGFLERRVLQ